jgi:citrate lyase alpha subunit
MSGATRLAKNPKKLLIDKKTAANIDAFCIIKDNFAVQTGFGGFPLAVTKILPY